MSANKAKSKSTQSSAKNLESTSSNSNYKSDLKSEYNDTNNNDATNNNDTTNNNATINDATAKFKVTNAERKANRFEVISEYKPSGDQPTAIAELEKRVLAGEKDIVLLGATGTGKSATTAWLIEKVQRPTLVIAPNKTLAAQLAK